MKTFVINTTGNFINLGIFDNDSLIKEFKTVYEDTPPETERLLEYTEALLKEAKTKIKELGLIVVAIGPGSYTGSRSGLSFAKAITQVNSNKIIGVSLNDAVYFSDFLGQDATISIELRSERYFSKKYGKKIDLLNQKNSDYKIEQQLTKDTKIIKQSDISLTQLYKFGSHLFKLKKHANFMTLLPLYIKEPEITQPKKVYELI